MLGIHKCMPSKVGSKKNINIVVHCKSQIRLHATFDKAEKIEAKPPPEMIDTAITAIITNTIMVSFSSTITSIKSVRVSYTESHNPPVSSGISIVIL